MKLKNCIWSIYNTIFPYKKYRPMTQFMATYFKNKNNLTGCEIGVAKGINARSMFDALPIKKMYLIAPYISWIDSLPNKGENVERNYIPYKKIAEKQLRKYRDKCLFITKKSDEAVKDVKDELDFVYIDGNHKYEYVKNDIELYYQKTKKGGIIGGHDFSGAWGVPKAVLEFVEIHNIKLYGWGDDWWVVKP